MRPATKDTIRTLLPDLKEAEVDELLPIVQEVEQLANRGIASPEGSGRRLAEELERILGVPRALVFSLNMLALRMRGEVH